MAPLYEELKKRTRQLWQQQNLLEERIKRKAYGFHDLRYFTLKIYQAFSNYSG